MAVRLWVLQPIDEDNVPWRPWYDKCFGLVVRAETDAEARRIAGDNADCEGVRAWLDATLSTCCELTADGPDGVVMKDVHNA